MTLDELEALRSKALGCSGYVIGDMPSTVIDYLNALQIASGPLIAVYRAAERHARHGPVTPTAAEARCAASSETRAELLAALAALR